MSARHSAFAAGGSYKASKYGNAGGSKKSGLVPSNGRGDGHNIVNWTRTKASVSEKDRQIIYTVNMLGGIGAGRSQFNTANTYARPDGVRRRRPYNFWRMFDR
jgi:hypothetical protein